VRGPLPGRELGLEECLTFTGPVAPTEVEARLAQAEILVLPNTGTKVSARYTSPLKLFEYLAAGKPIIASDLPALREVLRQEENCLLTPPGDARALADAIKRLAADPALSERLARQAFADADQYTWDRRAARLEQLFEHLVGTARPAAS
jgi:glycosyltransferase involved in cell wall biosynthesis